MRHSRKLLTGLGILALALGLSACGTGHGQANDTGSLTLKTYTVPDGRAKDLSRTLNRVLSMGSGKSETGKAWFSGSQQILVLAPQRMQESIASSLKEMTGQNAAAEIPQPVRLDAWIVDARPGAGTADPSLEAIQPALTAFAKAMGPTHFEQAHYLSAVSDTGSQTVISPMPAHVLGYTVTKTAGGLVLNFNYHNGGRGLRGQVTTKLGQTLVLGLISDQPAGGHAKAPAVPRLLVVRVTPATQS